MSSAGDVDGGLSACGQDQPPVLICIADDNIFQDWMEEAARERFADAMIITTPDRLHKSGSSAITVFAVVQELAVAFAGKGYHVLLEKPMAVTVEDCQQIVCVSGERSAISHMPRAQVLACLPENTGAARGEPLVTWPTSTPSSPLVIITLHTCLCRGIGHVKRRARSLLAISCHDINTINSWMGGEGA
ncbi:uncharacterized protein zgc:154075 isoform X2 [Callorhinchus milii]|uniref:uncharacterized protein zgc:154075 isoform X2 n=1 Tax=Callorhinchus milii TaxID=7868 RepID=UPI001C3F99B3|nr:uncharacterized protein zgc:154075 isoform X2 [Callorhinchus milii]